MMGEEQRDGRDPAPRFEFIQNGAAAVDEDAMMLSGS